MGKPRLLIPVLLHFGVRYVLRTGMLARLSEFVDPIIAISWNDSDLIQEFQTLGAQVIEVPPFRFDNEFGIIRQQVNAWHRKLRETPTTKIDRRREYSLKTPEERIKSTIRELKGSLKLLLPVGVEHMQLDYQRLLWEKTNIKEFEELLSKTQPDAILSITPYANREEPLLQAARKNHISCYASILSFDNVTSRSWIPINFDHYMVWNKYNSNEIVRSYPGVKEDDITLTGPPQFDFYYDKTYIWDKNYWKKILGIPENRPIILFGGGTFGVVPNEPYWLSQIDEDISNNKIPGNPIILFRRHPGDVMDRWRPILKNAKNIIVDQSWMANEKKGQTNITRENIENLTSTLQHCDVHINASSTLTVDGSIFNRPQIGPAFDAGGNGKFDRVLKDLYIREHYLPITRSGGLDLVNSREEMNQAIATALDSPEKMREGRKKIVQEICTYADGNSTTRVVDTLRNLLK
jgi:CDP-glycerol glycerophosphotransferase (TagB/SpsB family)